VARKKAEMAKEINGVTKYRNNGVAMKDEK